MKHHLDLNIFDNNPHNPSLQEIRRKMTPEPQEIVDFCVPVNNGFPPPELLQRMKDNLVSSLKFYPSSNRSLAEILARFTGEKPNQLLLANGSTELITWIVNLFVTKNILIPIPTFARWTDVPIDFGKELFLYQREREGGFQIDIDRFCEKIANNSVRSAVICNPNNPTGAWMPLDKVEELLERLRSLDLVVIDESFIEFSSIESPRSSSHLVDRFPNLIVLKSLGKNFGLHGLRFGYMVANEKLIQKAHRRIPKWNVNGMAEFFLSQLPEFRSCYEKSRISTIQQTRYLENALGNLPGLEVFPSAANFVYAKLSSRIDGVRLRNELLLEKQIYIRVCSNKRGSDGQFLRISARPQDQVDLLVTAIQEIVLKECA